MMEVRKREGGRESEGEGESEGEREEEKERKVLIFSLLCSCSPSNYHRAGSDQLYCHTVGMATACHWGNSRNAHQLPCQILQQCRQLLNPCSPQQVRGRGQCVCVPGLIVAYMYLKTTSIANFLIINSAPFQLLFNVEFFAML